MENSTYEHCYFSGGLPPQHQLERVRYADGSGEQTTYDATGRLVCIQVLDQEQEPVHGQDITLAYDLWGRIIHRNHAGTSQQFAYDPRGLLSELINENHARSQFEWDAMDRLVKETGVDGRTQHYHYNAMGLLTGQDDGHEEQWSSLVYDYDEKDNLTVRRWGNPDGQSEVTHPADLPEYLRARPNPAFEQRFEWDEQRHLSKAQLYAGHGEQARLEAECLFEYSPAGLLTTETQRIWDSTLQPEPKLLHEYRLEHQHDVLGNRTQSVLPDVGELGILRYGAGHVQGVALNHHALLDIHRDALHREVKRQWLSDETTAPANPITREQHWDPKGRLHQRIYQHLPVHWGSTQNQLESQPPSTHNQHPEGPDVLLNLQHRHYHYDALGQLTHIQQPRQIQYYGYDKHGRLTAARLGDDDAHLQGWWFDAAGNPLPPPHAKQPSPADRAETVRQRWHEPGFNVLEFAYASENAQAHYWPDNRVYFSKHERYQYDAQGNRTHSHNSQTGETKHYQYNSLNQLIQVEHHKANQTLERSRYTYDPLGRLIKLSI